MTGLPGRIADAMRRPLVRYLVRRLATCAALLALLSLVVFVGVGLLPGDPVTNRIGLTATAGQLAQARRRAGLDRPLLDRYGDWLGGLLHGHLGTSLVSGRPVGQMLGDRIGNSAVLAGTTLLLVVPLSLGLGLWAGWRRGGRVDRAISTAALLLVAVPEYAIAGGLALVFAVSLHWLPAVSLLPDGVGPLARPGLLVLPVLSLMLLSLAHASRVIRAATAATLRAPHVEYARLNGGTGRSILRHAVLPAVLPVALQVWCVAGVGLVGGAVLVERVYGYPGIGQLLVISVQAGDLPVAQALALVVGGAMLLALLLADMAHLVLTPRLRSAS